MVHRRIKKASIQKLDWAIITYAQKPDRLKSLRRNAPSISQQIFTEDVLGFVDWLENFDIILLDSLILADSREIPYQLEASHALRFCIRVMLPCMYFFGETHHAIFQNVKNGDIDSICKLLIIDKSVIAIPQIAEIFTMPAFMILAHSKNYKLHLLASKK